MKQEEKLITRARLIASGAIRWWQYEKPIAVGQWCEILAEELAKIEDQAVVQNIRESVLRYGLHVPELRSIKPPNGSEETSTEAESASDSRRDEHEREQSTFLYTRRAPNQVSEYTEAHIRELLNRGLTKSAVARALRVNRRVVIRVWREAQSAHQHQKCHTDDLGTLTEGR
jgi:hypothetical protein